MEQNLPGPSRSKTTPNSTTTIQLPFRSTVTQYQRSLIAQSLSHAEKEFRQISAEIRRLKSAIMILETRRHEVEKKVEVYRSLLAPIHRMPSEIMVEIFCHVCSDRSRLSWLSAPAPVYRTSIPYVVTLSLVCSRWRELVSSSSMLWASMEITTHSGSYKGNMNRALKLFLTHSRDQPLDLELNYRGPEDNPGALNLVIRECRRWKRLSLFSGKKPFHDPQLGGIRGNLPLLTHLTLGGALEDGSFSNVFEVAPCLHSVSVRPASIIIPSLRLPWQQLRSIYLSDTTLNPILQALALCPNLEQVTLVCSRFKLRPEESNADLKVDLLAVSSLSIIVTDARCILDVFRQCDWPDLKSLKICNSGWKSVWDTPFVNSFLLRPLHCLVSLHLERVPFPEDETISLLQQIPTLHTLFILDNGRPSISPVDDRPRNMTITSTFLQQLSLPHLRQQPTVSEPCRLLLPQLNTLSLRVHAKDLDQRALVNAVVSRCPDTTQTSARVNTDSHSYLRSFTVTVINANEKDSFDILESLECFGEAGLVVSINISNFIDHEEEEDEDED
ncbi:hypothetical protein L218DRAFT_249052 [Marasmius fiardii PR-910]|nr:hypothetical protein L218DRAFT_249052 [Marasmius fiardii PR-910]